MNKIFIVIASLILFSLALASAHGGNNLEDHGMIENLGINMIYGFGFGWLMMILIVVILILFIVWLIKQISIQDKTKRRKRK